MMEETNEIRNILLLKILKKVLERRPDINITNWQIDNFYKNYIYQKITKIIGS